MANPKVIGRVAIGVSRTGRQDGEISGRAGWKTRIFGLNIAAAGGGGEGGSLESASKKTAEDGYEFLERFA